MAETTEDANPIEKRLGSVEKQVTELRGDFGGLRGEVGELRGEVHKLRVLGEETDRRLTLVAEVQGRHGAKLDGISKALEPLAEIHDFVRLVAHDHEHRIAELEKRTGVRK